MTERKFFYDNSVYGIDLKIRDNKFTLKLYVDTLSEKENGIIEGRIDKIASCFTLLLIERFTLNYMKSTWENDEHKEIYLTREFDFENKLTPCISVVSIAEEIKVDRTVGITSEKNQNSKSFNTILLTREILNLISYITNG